MSIYKAITYAQVSYAQVMHSLLTGYQQVMHRRAGHTTTSIVQCNYTLAVVVKPPQGGSVDVTEQG